MGRGGDQIGQRLLGRAICVLRKRAGLTQTKLGQRAELHQTWICHIEAEEVNLTWGNLRRIAGGLGVPLDAARVKAGLSGFAVELAPPPISEAR